MSHNTVTLTYTTHTKLNTQQQPFYPSVCAAMTTTSRTSLQIKSHTSSTRSIPATFRTKIASYETFHGLQKYFTKATSATASNSQIHRNSGYIKMSHCRQVLTEEKIFHTLLTSEDSIGSTSVKYLPTNSCSLQVYNSNRVSWLEFNGAFNTIQVLSLIHI